MRLVHPRVWKWETLRVAAALLPTTHKTILTADKEFLSWASTSLPKVKYMSSRHTQELRLPAARCEVHESSSDGDMRFSIRRQYQIALACLTWSFSMIFICGWEAFDDNNITSLVLVLVSISRSRVFFFSINVMIRIEEPFYKQRIVSILPKMKLFSFKAPKGFVQNRYRATLLLFISYFTSYKSQEIHPNHEDIPWLEGN